MSQGDDVRRGGRRTFLKTAGVAGLTLTAGCQGLGGGGGDGGDGGDGGGGGGDGGGGGGGGDGGAQRGDPVMADYWIYNRASDEARHETKLIIADALEDALGMTIERHIAPADQVVDIVIAQPSPREHDIATQRTGEGYDPDPYLYGFWHSEATQPGGINMAQFVLPEYDEMYDRQRSMTDIEERRQLVNEMQELVYVTHPQTYVPLFIQNLPALYRTDRLRNLQTIPERIVMNVYNFIDLELVSGDWPVIRGAFNSVEYINPLFVGNRENREHNDLIYDRLVRMPPGETDPEPWAAESFEAIDEVTYEFTIRDGMTFHDGEDVTAEDVRFSFEYVGEESGTLNALVEPIDEIDISGRTLTVHLSQPYAPFITETLRRVPILPQHIWQDVPESVDAAAAADWENPEAIGSGIFRMDYWEPGEELSLLRNDDHFMDINTEHYVFRLLADQSAMAREIEAGSIDIAMRPTEDAVARLEQNQNIGVERSRLHSPIFMPLNCARVPMNNGALREAMSYVVPKQDLIDTVWFGAAEPIGSMVAPGIPGWTNEDMPVRAERDDDSAIEVLEDAGFTWDNSGQLYLPADYDPSPPEHDFF